VRRFTAASAWCINTSNCERDDRRRKRGQVKKRSPISTYLVFDLFAALFGIGLIWLSFQNDLIYNVFALAVLAAGL
jgi:hypothetical protein